MKRLKDLPEDTNIQKIKVKLSEKLYNNSSLPDYDIKSREVYLQGSIMNDFFVKLDLKSDQIYPLYRDFIDWDELKDLEVIEE